MCRATDVCVKFKNYALFDHCLKKTSKVTWEWLSLARMNWKVFVCLTFCSSFTNVEPWRGAWYILEVAISTLYNGAVFIATHPTIIWLTVIPVVECPTRVSPAIYPAPVSLYSNIIHAWKGKRGPKIEPWGTLIRIFFTLFKKKAQ